STGSPFRTPYQVYEETYGAAPYMVWQKTKAEPLYRHEILRKHNVEQDIAEYNSPISIRLLRTLATAGIFFLGPILLVTCLMIFLPRASKARFQGQNCNLNLRKQEANKS